jgi:hypothetical protein
VWDGLNRTERRKNTYPISLTGKKEIKIKARQQDEIITTRDGTLQNCRSISPNLPEGLFGSVAHFCTVLATTVCAIRVIVVAWMDVPV